MNIDNLSEYSYAILQITVSKNHPLQNVEP